MYKEEEEKETLTALQTIKNKNKKETDYYDS